MTTGRINQVLLASIDTADSGLQQPGTSVTLLARRTTQYSNREARVSLSRELSLLLAARLRTQQVSRSPLKAVLVQQVVLGPTASMRRHALSCR